MAFEVNSHSTTSTWWFWLILCHWEALYIDTEVFSLVHQRSIKKLLAMDFRWFFVHQTSGDIPTRAPGRYCKTLWPEWRGWVQRCWRFISNFDLLNLENPQTRVEFVDVSLTESIMALVGKNRWSLATSEAQARQDVLENVTYARAYNAEHQDHCLGWNGGHKQQDPTCLIWEETHWTLGYIDKSNEYVSISYIDIISKSKLTATWSHWFLNCRVCSLEGRVTNRNWLCWQD